MFVAKNKKGLGLLVGVVAVGLTVAGTLTPPEYSQFVGLLWLPWLALLGWLGWSIVAPLVFAVEAVKVERAGQMFDQFENALDKLSSEQGEMRIELQTAVTYQETLIDLLVGFIEEAERLAKRRDGLNNTGKVSVSDPKLSYLLTNLDGVEQQRVIDHETGNLTAQEQAYRMQAKALLNRVVEARGRIAQQQMKLRTTDAAIPLLQMNDALGKCQSRLVELNHALPEPASLKRRLLN